MHSATRLPSPENGMRKAHSRRARRSSGWLGRRRALLLRRYDVQLFVWYTLPRKFLTTLEHKRGAAAALAITLERIGGLAASYAHTCHARETRELVCAWENGDPGAWRRFRELLELVERRNSRPALPGDRRVPAPRAPPPAPPPQAAAPHRPPTCGQYPRSRGVR